MRRGREPGSPPSHPTSGAAEAHGEPIFGGVHTGHAGCWPARGMFPRTPASPASRFIETIDDLLLQHRLVVVWAKWSRRAPPEPPARTSLLPRTSARPVRTVPSTEPFRGHRGAPERAYRPQVATGLNNPFSAHLERGSIRGLPTRGRRRLEALVAPFCKPSRLGSPA